MEFYAQSTSAVISGRWGGTEWLRTVPGGPVVLLPLHRSAAQGRRAVKQALEFASVTGQRGEDSTTGIVNAGLL